MTINESATVPFPSLIGVNGSARARDHSKWCMLYVDVVISLFCPKDLLVAAQWPLSSASDSRLFAFIRNRRGHGPIAQNQHQPIAMAILDMVPWSTGIHFHPPWFHSESAAIIGNWKSLAWSKMTDTHTHK